MTTEQLERKVKDLEEWIKKNPATHPCYSLIVKDKRDFERKLAVELRLNTLLVVLKYTTEKTAMLTPGERTMINQERGYLISLYNERPLPKRQVSPEIEKKINTILELIKVTGWEQPNKDEY